MSRVHDLDAARPSASLLQQRARALTVPCTERGCDAVEGDPCLNLVTGDPLQSRPAHESRLRAAGEAHGPTAREDDHA